MYNVGQFYTGITLFANFLLFDYISKLGEYAWLIGSSIKGRGIYIVRRESTGMGTAPGEAEYYFLQSEY